MRENMSNGMDLMGSWNGRGHACVFEYGPVTLRHHTLQHAHQPGASGQIAPRLRADHAIGVQVEHAAGQPYFWAQPPTWAIGKQTLLGM